MEEKNFYEMGQQFAEETIKDMAKKAQEIEKQYGIDAKLEFEAGIASTISQFDNFYGSDSEYNEPYMNELSEEPRTR